MPMLDNSYNLDKYCYIVWKTPGLQALQNKTILMHKLKL
jgi:hypothetical protein